METVSFRKGDRIQQDGKVYEFVKYEKCVYGRHGCNGGNCPGFIVTIPRLPGCGWLGAKCAYTLVEKKEEKMKTTFEHKFKVGDKVKVLLTGEQGEVINVKYQTTCSLVTYDFKGKICGTRTISEPSLILVPELTEQEVHDGIVRDYYEFVNKDFKKDTVLYIKRANWEKLMSFHQKRMMYVCREGSRMFIGCKVFVVNDEDAPEWRWA